MDYITNIDSAAVMTMLECFCHDDPENPTEFKDSIAKVDKLFLSNGEFNQEEAREVLAELYDRYGDIVETYMEVDYSEDHNRLARWRELALKWTRDRGVAMVRRLRNDFFEWKLTNAVMSQDAQTGEVEIGLKIEHDGKQCTLWCSGLNIASFVLEDF